MSSAVRRSTRSGRSSERATNRAVTSASNSAPRTSAELRIAESCEVLASSFVCDWSCWISACCTWLVRLTVSVESMSHCVVVSPVRSWLFVPRMSADSSSLLASSTIRPVTVSSKMRCWSAVADLAKSFLAASSSASAASRARYWSNGNVLFWKTCSRMPRLRESRSLARATALVASWRRTRLGSEIVEMACSPRSSRF